MSIEVRGVCPLLQVFDMPTSVRFYRDVLGFEIVETSPRDHDGSRSRSRRAAGPGCGSRSRSADGPLPGVTGSTGTLSGTFLYGCLSQKGDRDAQTEPDLRPSPPAGRLSHRSRGGGRACPPRQSNRSRTGPVDASGRLPGAGAQSRRADLRSGPGDRWVRPLQPSPVSTAVHCEVPLGNSLLRSLGAELLGRQPLLRVREKLLLASGPAAARVAARPVPASAVLGKVIAVSDEPERGSAHSRP
jgi:catechol 2,3-dioxygenase-like lactoylglutathione lyase family enzyme